METLMSKCRNTLSLGKVSALSFIYPGEESDSMSDLPPTFKGLVSKQTQEWGQQLRWLRVHRLELPFEKSVKVLGGEEGKGKCYGEPPFLACAVD